MLLDMLSDEFPKYSQTEIENLLVREIENEDTDIRQAVSREYFGYVIDVILSLIAGKQSNFHLKNIFLQGALFESTHMKQLFSEMIKKNIPDHVHIFGLEEATGVDPDHSCIYGLSLLGEELLYTKKDPIIRILRYTLYHYE